LTLAFKRPWRAWHGAPILENVLNHIQRLQADLTAANDKIAAMNEALNDLRRHLLSAKFQTPQNGERADWIATADVLRWVENIKSAE
jgi:hypothetical protein